ncbi:FAD-dependent oxidoreductase [Roseomonas sp. BN140053]|uniref:oxidoreductase n=1 Tax=Roseomonas sp. BN140053 TaxID=3391898 RepID=UPI0039E7778A
MTSYPHLLSPIRLGKHEIRNRVWMAAHATLLVKDNLFTDAHIHYYRERARGGVGIITMEAMAVHPTTQPYKGKAFAFDPRMVPQYQKIADAVHEYGTKILAQPWHRGRETSSVASLEPVWAPSPIPDAVYREVPKEMTVADINAIIEGYRLTARFARQGGLDGVEVHAMSHGYLLNQFLSPATNHRRDAFGGSLENRLRIVLEILDATRQETGPDMIVGVRINGDDGHEGGLRPDDWAEIAARLDATGHLDYISVTQGTYLNRMLIYPTSPMPHGYQMPATRKIKEAVSVPVVGVGRVVDPAEAEDYIARGDCDMVALARALIADPEWVRKAAEARREDIRPCVGANWCMSSIFAQAPIACIHNPAAGAELGFGTGTLAPAEAPRKVAVVGGGPAGMRAALTAADRGHAVTLFERQPELGGQVRLWARASSRQELTGVVDWLGGQLAKRPVTIRCQTVATPEMLEAEGFEAIVVATGSHGLKHGWTPLHPERWDGPVLPGADQPNVWTYHEVLRDEPALGANVLLVDSLGGRQGAVVAEYLARRGHTVEFVTQLGQGSPDLASSRDWGKVHGMLRKLGVRFTVDSELVSIAGNTVTLRDIYTDEQHTRDPVHDVVFVLGAAVDDALFHALEPRRATGLDLHLIGDALSPRRASDAIREGEIAARAL